MTQATPAASASTPDTPFTAEQQQYLQGFTAGLKALDLLPAVMGAAQQTTETSEPLWFNTPADEVCREERIKMDADPFTIWDRMVQMAERNEPPADGDIFRFKYHGLFWVAPAQESFMVRVRVPGNVLRADQFRALAALSEDLGNGMADITTRGAIQIRGIAPSGSIETLKRLSEAGLTSRGAGADNVRNITISPTAGIDAQEIIDTRRLARDLQFYLLNHREMYELPRKFNIAFDGGGRLSNASDTNDIAFIASRIVAHGTSRTEGTEGAAETSSEPLFKAGAPVFRVLLAGITGHQRFAQDCGVVIHPEQAIDVAGAMTWVFAQHSDRTNRKNARLCYLLDRIGVDEFLRMTETRLGYALPRLPSGACEPRAPVDKMAHLGMHPQKQHDLFYAGLVLPVGRISVAQMRDIATLAETFSQGEIRLTVWQNLLLPNIPASKKEALMAALAEYKLSADANGLIGTVVSCTGNTGCKFAEAETKGHATAIHHALTGQFALDRPINIHLTGCPNSCAQHYIGDIGFMGVQMPTAEGQTKVEGYNVYLGGGTDQEQAIAKELVKNMPADKLAPMIALLVKNYQTDRSGSESFADFTRRLPLETLQHMAGLTV